MGRTQFGNIRRLKSGRYQARYRYRGNDYIGPGTFKTRALAQGWLNKEEELITFDKWAPPAQRQEEQANDEERRALTVGAWLEQHLESLTRGAQPIRHSTAQHYRRVIDNRIIAPIAPGDEEPDIIRLKDIPLVDLVKGDVYRWWDALERVYDTAETNRKAYMRLKAACAEAIRRELITISPVDILAASRKPDTKEQYLPKDWELAAIVEAVNPRYRLLTILCLYHGLRIGEALALESDCFVSTTPVPYAPVFGVRVKQNAQRLRGDNRRTYMRIQPPKSKAGYRVVPFMPRFVPYLYDHLEHYMDASPVEVETWEGPRSVRLLTTTARGRIFTDAGYRGVLRRVARRVGADEGIKPHSGRRWLTTRLAERGAHLKEIGSILGDNDLTTITKIYMKVRAERTEELMGELSDSLGVD
ncbi:tyrosine-type recombinase/integrase [Corynebacterium spheniscorum]|uniref:Phage integrase family protein n=1 Tax=Corynebacterium spheniscorum TaxID=185761 RepID=A0A1I2TFC2_9CORY|nr:site-specific integrase [Corynebacterium spheniscorum]KAA8721181.1 site-specific integrase [Corynebacterium spheniscorum]SFG63612.1 Phage integrase family protein [Corynebacterium spheniscorum]